MVRYDGLAFTVYTPENTKALPGYWINGVNVDRRGRLWVSTARGLVVKEDTGFRHVDLGDPKISPWEVLEDGHGQLWVATEDGVLVGDGHRFELVQETKAFTYALALDSLDRVWMAGRSFLAYSDGRRVVKLTTQFPRISRFFDVMVDGRSSVWIATERGGVQLGLDAQGTPSIVRTVSTRTGGEQRPVWTLGRTPDGAIWLGTSTGGMMMWDGQSLRTFVGSAEETWSFLTGTRGELWVGTALGLERYQRSAFTNVDAGLPDRSLWAVREDDRGAMWTALANGGVYQWKGGRFVERAVAAGNAGSVAIAAVPGGMLVVFGNKLVILPQGDGPSTSIATGDLSPGLIYGVMRDSADAIWLSADSGLFRVAHGRAQRMNDSLGLPRTSAPRDMRIDSAGRLLLGNPGLTIVERGRVQHYGIAEGLTDTVVNALYPRGDKIWIATADSGLFVLQRNRIVSVGQRDRRLHEGLIAIAEDDLGYFWLAWRYGLTRVAIGELDGVAEGIQRRLALRDFDATDGLAITSFEMDYQRTIAKDAAGRLWFPGTSGAVVVDPRIVLVDSTPPQIHIEQVVVDGRPHPFRDAFSLPAGVGRVEITFAVTDASFPRRARVRFRLRGVDTSWTDAGQRRTASFGPLRGGEYQFEVQTASDAGHWTTALARVTFDVAFTWPEHEWFLPSLLLAAVGVALLTARVRQRALVRRGAELARVVDERTRDLETARLTLEARVEERTSQLADELAERSRLEQRLLQAQKLEGLGRLAGGVAHEINNSMTGVLGFTELAARAAGANPAVLQDLDEARRAGERVASITRQLLAFARRQQATKTVFDLQSLVDQNARGLRQVVGPDVRLKTAATSPRPPVHADRAQLEQVLLNLVMNAKDAMPNGGEVLIQVTHRQLEHVQAIGGADLKPGEYLVLSVTDTGSGMANDVRTRLFEPFFTTKHADRGTGMGLAVCHGIVNQHGGAIAVESQLGHGTTFDVWLPAAERSTEIPAVPSEQPPGNETILLVEDDELVRKIAQRVLRANGYRVMVAEHGGEALALSDEQLSRVNLVLTDVMMPKVNGVELARGLIARRLDVPFLFMSGFTGHENDLTEELSRMGPMLAKPFTGKGLLAAVRHELDQRPASGSATT